MGLFSLNALSALFEVALDFLFGGIIPFLAMTMLIPTLEVNGVRVTNYRGNSVVYGLGIVWILWALFLFLLSSIVTLVPYIGRYTALTVLAPSLPLVISAAAFGLIDDAYGDSSSKGFKGHIKAMLHGRLTTGGLKILGIGFASLMTALVMERSHNGGVLYVILATCVMALCANLLNLFDLRPGRALKVYLVLFALVCACGFVFDQGVAISTMISVLLLGVAPTIAVWRFDLGERAMLGDSGANAAGVFVGFLFAAFLPLWILAVVVIILIVLNFSSEKISFSKVIEGNSVLSALDGAGRHK